MKKLNLNNAFSAWLKKFLDVKKKKKTEETPTQEKPKVDEDKLKKSIAEKEKIIKGNKPIKK